MNRLTSFTLFAVTTALLSLIWPQQAHAADMLAYNAGASAQLSISTASASPKMDIRRVKLERYLKNHNSDLSEHTNHIIDLADRYDLPWTLVPAIAGVESTFCQHIPAASYNCWGWNNGGTAFADYPEALETVSHALKTHYIDRGMDTPEAMSHVYAPPSTTWAGKVRHYMNEIEYQDIATVPTLQITL
jgi:hypothetical protein